MISPRSGALLAALVCATSAAADTAIPPNTNWTSYNHHVNGQRYVPLDAITKDNAGAIGPVCQRRIEDVGAFHTGILHIDGLLYLTTATDTVALDSASCRIVWRHHHVEEAFELSTLRVNRGLAYANGRLYRGTVDAQLIALDAASGALLWKHQVGDPAAGEFFSAAPQIYQGLVIIGAAGGDWGIRGRVMAYDAVTGREAWRFWTIPRGDEPGADSWKNAGSARFGGGGTWTTYTLDLASGELFVPVGNPAPDLLPDTRPGENLYTNSLVVLDANTGKLKWYHQLLSNDGQDLDLGAAPVLYFNDKGDRMVAFGSKDGYVYGINRETRKRVFRTQVTRIKNAGVVPTVAGIDVCPGPLGGVEWNGPAFDRPNRALIVGAVDWCAKLKAEEGYAYRPGEFNLGGTFEFIGEARGWIYALDADTGEVRWKRETAGPHVAGITPTAGGVVFTGDLAGNFLVLDSASGAVLHQSQAGGGLAGGVITYMRDGRQYVAFVSGNVSRLTFGNAGSPTLHVYALGSAAAGTTVPAAASAGGEPVADISAGRASYSTICAGCHGSHGEGGTGPKLAGIGARMERARIVEWIKNPSEKMPRLFPALLDERAVENVAAYLQTL